MARRRQGLCVGVCLSSLIALWSIGVGWAQALGQNSVTALHPQEDPLLAKAEFDRSGSTNVPMDSWMYPALERLAALGLIPTQSISIRPWTRRECLRQVNEAFDHATHKGELRPRMEGEAERLIDDLHRELDGETDSSGTATLESVYVRGGTIAGPALADSYHFGQTWWNDFGRPQGRGTSAIAGVSVRANAGRFFGYVREEAQHGPGNPAQSTALVQLINQLDTIPITNEPRIAPVAAESAYQRFRPIELYTGVIFAGNALSVGKQELYWGPTVSGPLSFSSNAEPTWNVRFVATRPHAFPWVFASLGTYRFDLVAGKLSGHNYPAGPLFNGQKLALNLGENIEISMTRWSLLCGAGHPCGVRAFARNFASTSSGGTSVYGDPTDPGDRKSGFDFRFKPPGLKRLLTLYADTYADDEINPLMDPNRSGYSPGIYFAQLPYLPRMDLRIESNSTNPYAGDQRLGGFLTYWNIQYLDANTNKGFLVGNAVGRDGHAIEAHLGYWISGRSRAEVMYRQNKGGPHFLPGGSTITDVSYRESFTFRKDWTAEVFAQYERHWVPSIESTAQSNVSGWFHIMWNPQLQWPKAK